MKEFGAPVRGLFFEGKAIDVAGDWPNREQPARSRKALQGIAADWLTWHIGTDGGWEIFGRHCFGRSLERLRLDWREPISILIDHDRTKKLGDTTTGLELISDDAVGLAFRFLLPETDIAHEAARSAGAAERASVSVGFRVIHAEQRVVEGTPVRWIHEADLVEISILPDGAVKGATCSLIDPTNEPSLAYLVETKHLRGNCAATRLLSINERLRTAVSQLEAK